MREGPRAHARALLTLASSEGGLDRHDPIELSTLAEHVLTAPSSEPDSRSLQIETALAPASTAGYPALLERLIANLIDNARHYNAPGGRIEVETGRSAGRAFLSVVNTGPVIAPEDVDRLFEPFQRRGSNRTADREAGRHGLGLSIVRAIAAAHDASLAVQAGPEGGLAVTVSFLERRAPLTGSVETVD